MSNGSGDSYFESYEDLESTAEEHTDNDLEEVLEVFSFIDHLDAFDSLHDANRAQHTNSNFESVDPLIYQLPDEIQDEIQTETVSMTVLRDITNPLELFSNEEFKQRYSFSKETIVDVIEMILPSLERSDRRGRPVPPIIELLITIKYMCSGNFQHDIDDIHGVSQPTISRFITKVASLLSEIRTIKHDFSLEENFHEISKKFYKKGEFPCVVGCLGSTQVGVKKAGSEISESYLNENGYHSLKVQVISGPDLEILHYDSRWPGATHDNNVFEISDAKHDMENKQHHGVLLGSSSYQLRPYLFTPITDPKTEQESKYNECYFKTNNFAKCIDLWKRRFKCLSTIMQIREKTSQVIIHAAVNLHNIAIERNESLTVEEMNCMIKEPKRKDVKRAIHLDIDPEPREDGIIARQIFIQQYFES